MSFTVLGLNNETTMKMNPAEPIDIPTISTGIPTKNVKRMTGNNTTDEREIPDFFLPRVILIEMERIANSPKTIKANSGVAESTGFFEG